MNSSRQAPTGDATWTELADAISQLQEWADRCRAMAQGPSLDAPVVTLLTERVAAVVEELAWEVAPASPSRSTPT